MKRLINGQTVSKCFVTAKILGLLVVLLLAAIGAFNLFTWFRSGDRFGGRQGNMTDTEPLRHHKMEIGGVEVASSKILAIRKGLVFSAMSPSGPLSDIESYALWWSKKPMRIIAAVSVSADNGAPTEVTIPGKKKKSVSVLLDPKTGAISSLDWARRGDDGELVDLRVDHNADCMADVRLKNQKIVYVRLNGGWTQAKKENGKFIVDTADGPTPMSFVDGEWRPAQ